jgi:tRNA threonylcarbamoyladenosine biosynthesis protein TsaE
MLTLHLTDSAATERCGARVAPTLEGGMVISLGGDLGTGKTTFVRGLLRALGVQGPIKSPSYSLVEHYPISSLYFYHFDFYRFVDPHEWESAGISDYFRDDAVCLVEWPERVAGLLPVPDLALTFAYPVCGNGRELRALAFAASAEPCLIALGAEVPAPR